VTIDLARFHRTFFEESFEGLDLMERELLRLDQGGSEAVHAVFRAAHSIKGGAATFGFSAVAAFTHHLETLLDQMRSGARPASPQLLDLLLRAVDALRALLGAARDGTPLDTGMIEATEAALQAVLDGRVATPEPKPAAAAPAAGAEFLIRFAPQPGLFSSGNDPLLILRELSGLGTLEVSLDTSALPGFSDADPQSCYLAWNLRLSTTHTAEQVREVFAWVEDECELRIEPLIETPVEKVSPAPALPSSTPTVSSLPGPARVAEAAPGDGGSVRVSTAKIDALINLVGELVITQAMLAQQAGGLDPVHNEKLLAGLQQLDRNTRQLQEAVMATRMLPIAAVFSRFPRMLHDLAAKLGKEVRLETHGESTELDKSMIEKIADPLTHLVRNAVDHGIETRERRLAAGKSAEGCIRLSAAHQGGMIVIRVADDGAGLDRGRILAKARANGLAVPEQASDAEVWQLIFAPGFSTAEQVSDISGRGVGMDVVKRNVESLGGRVEVESSPGQGAAVSIRLPLTLAILDGMSVGVGEETFIVPLNCVVESLQPQAGQLRSVAGQGTLLKVREEYLPLVALHQMFRVGGAVTEPRFGVTVVLEADGRKVALLVDQLLGQHQVVVKSVEANFRRVAGVAGATILGDGRVALIIDAAGIVRSTFRAAAA
jgi:two-component system, chemotaxis family, sensor kinase CheA